VKNMGQLDFLDDDFFTDDELENKEEELKKEAIKDMEEITSDDEFIIQNFVYKEWEEVVEKKVAIGKNQDEYYYRVMQNVGYNLRRPELTKKEVITKRLPFEAYLYAGYGLRQKFKDGKMFGQSMALNNIREKFKDRPRV